MEPRWNVSLEIPGSKSVTNRALILASLADGVSLLKNALESEDIFYLKEALKKLGVSFQSTPEGERVEKTQPLFESPKSLYLGDSATGLRFLTAFVSLFSLPITLTGSTRLQERPILELLNALEQLGVSVFSCSPLTIQGPLQGGRATLQSTESSQYLSALLMVSPYSQHPVHLEVEGSIVSQPYIEITLEMMKHFGITVIREKSNSFWIPQGRYQAQSFKVEADCSSSAYFFAAAALGQGEVCITNWNRETFQGDRHILRFLQEMGCFVKESPTQATVSGPHALKAITTEMKDYPDLVPVLAVVAGFAQGTSRFSGIAHLRYKESNRLQALVQELQRAGIHAVEGDDFLEIKGGEMTATRIHCYQDHRIAMSFSVAQIRCPQLEIDQPECVKKSFPTFWDLWRKVLETNSKTSP